MKRILLFCFVILVFSCSDENAIGIDELEKIQNMDIAKAEEHLTKNGWRIQKVKEEKTIASIVDFWDLFEHNIKTSQIGYGKTNEIIFSKLNTIDSTNLILSIRDLKYNIMGQMHKEGEFLNKNKVVRIITENNIFANELSNNKYKLIDTKTANNIFEKIYQKDSTIFWLTTKVEKPSAFEISTMNDNLNTYELILLDNNFYERAVMQRKHDVELRKMIEEIEKNK